MRDAALRGRDRASGWVQRHLPGEAQHLFALTIAIGVVCGLVAVAFHLAISAASGLLIERALGENGVTGLIWTIATPTLAGLVAGALLVWVPGARGSGIPQVKQAFALEGGRIRLRDAVGKFGISVLQIGSGASLGREGPTVQICAGAASALARVTSLPARNMRRLTPVGVAAGIAAAFNAPIAAVTFTIEEIVGSLDHSLLSGVVVAAAVAAVIERGVLGVHPVIEVAQSYGFDHPSSLVSYAVLGFVAAVVSVVFTDGLLLLRAAMRGVRSLPRWTHPAIGGLVTGVLAAVILAGFGATGVTGGGYDMLSLALAGQVGLRLLIVLCVVKVVATVASYSTGGAGGIFAPALFIGAMLGGVVGYLDVALLGHEAHQLGAFALVGMGAVFAGVIRAPITSVLIIFEMTGGYGLVLPLMLANMTAYGLARRWRPTPIYEALLAQDGITLPHATGKPHALEQLAVSDVMTAEPISAQSNQTIGTFAELLRAGVGLPAFTLAPVADADGRLVGVLAVARVRAAEAADELQRPIKDLIEPARTIRADAALTRAIIRMSAEGTRQLVVTDRETGTRVVGILALSDVVRAHARLLPDRDGAAPAARASGVIARRRATSATLSAIAVPMSTAVIVAGTTSVLDLRAALVAAPGNAVVVELDGHAPGIVMLEYLHDFLWDEELHRLLIVADVARAAPTVEADATFPDVLARFADAATDAVIVVDTSGAPTGLVTRAAVAEVLLASQAAREQAA